MEAIGVLDQASLDVNGQGVEGFALEVQKGSMAVPVLEGRSPSSMTEIALGAGALPEMDINDTVTLQVADAEDVELEVVGRVVLPPFDSAGCSHGARGPRRHRRPPDRRGEEPRPHLRRTPTWPRSKPGSRRSLSGSRSRPTPGPTRRVACSTSRTSGAFRGPGGVLRVARSGRPGPRPGGVDPPEPGQFATLRSLGFQRRQVVRAVAVFVLVLIGFAAVVGVPVGIVVGRLSWLAVVGDLGIEDTPSVPLGAAALAVLAAALAGLVLAAGPAWREARRPPVEMLRVE